MTLKLYFPLTDSLIFYYHSQSIGWLNGHQEAAGAVIKIKIAKKSWIQVKRKTHDDIRIALLYDNRQKPKYEGNPDALPLFYF